MLNVEVISEYCRSKPFSSECFPFDDVSLVFKVAGKMFALIALDEVPLKIALKCDPEKAIELRELYSYIEPAYHFNKKYWNSISIVGSVSEKLVFDLIDHSYDMVYSKLPLKIKRNLSEKN